MKRLLLIFSLLFTLLACSHGQKISLTERQKEFKENRVKWDINREDFSDYKLKANHFSPEIQDYSSILITSSSDGHVYDYKVYKYDTLLPDYYLNDSEVIHVDFLFDKVERAIASEAEDVIVEYNKTYGYPEKVHLRYKDGYEEEAPHTIHITEFTTEK